MKTFEYETHHGVCGKIEADTREAALNRLDQQFGRGSILLSDPKRSTDAGNPVSAQDTHQPQSQADIQALWKRAFEKVEGRHQK